MQSFIAEDFTAERYRDAAYGAYEAARSMSQARAIVTAAALFLAFGSVVVVLWLGAQRRGRGAHVRRRPAAVRPLRRAGRRRARAIVRSVERGSQAAGAAARIGELLAVEPRIAPPAEPLALPRPARGEVAFERVDFAYPDAR